MGVGRTTEKEADQKKKKTKKGWHEKKTARERTRELGEGGKHSQATRSMEKKYMERYKGTYDMFFGIEHRMRTEEMKEKFNKQAKQVWKFAADAARITDESAGSEDFQHRLGVVFVAIENGLGAVVEKEGAVRSITGNE